MQTNSSTRVFENENLEAQKNFDIHRKDEAFLYNTQGPTVWQYPELAKSSQIKRRSKYQMIHSETRRNLLHLVENVRKTIREASDKLGLNYSTAKTILQLYRKTGRIDRINSPCSLKDLNTPDLT